MDNDIANRFLNGLTGPDGNEQSKPRVILVRSNGSMKQFITQALGEVEKLVELTKVGTPDWRTAEAALYQLAKLASDHEQHNIDLAARDIASLAHALSTTPDTGAFDKPFGDFVTYLSTMLLRVYIEGDDARCVWELSCVEVLLTQCHERAKRLRRQRLVMQQLMN